MASKHILYSRSFCGFCWRVLAEVKALGIDIEVRNTWESEEHLAELQAATGRSTVPVLRIVDSNGESQWMPESADIIRYLKKTFGA